jgi:pimeloyl-ACP methyl ester carboxylesterase
MATAIPIHPEGSRYRASLVFVPGLWAGPQLWKPVATYLAHRGWAGTILDLRSERDGILGRGRVVAEHVRRLGTPTVLVGHDAGALVAIAAATHVRLAAMVLAAPLVPSLATTHAYVSSWRLGWPDGARAIGDVVRRRAPAPPAPTPPALVVHGGRDPLLPADAARAFAATLGAESHELPDAGRWLVAGRGWQACVDAVHGWLVRRLGESLLELYEEAMAERDAADDDG